MNPSTYFDAVMSLPIDRYRAGYSNDSLIIGKSGSLVVEYAPFDHIERDAELAIVGLTPGRVQAANALEALRTSLASGQPPEVALQSAKRTASFSGPMRKNLTAMLDEIGLPNLYGRSSADEFFDQRRGGIHLTSVIRYPVYVAGQNYSGSPPPLRNALLKSVILNYFAAELEAVQRAVWVPLGRHAEYVMLTLAAQGKLPRQRILAGLPHPSGANAERISYFLGRKSRQTLSKKTNPSSLEAAKYKLLAQIASLRQQVGVAVSW